MEDFRALIEETVPSDRRIFNYYEAIATNKDRISRYLYEIMEEK